MPLKRVLLADDFWRLAHSDITGRPLLHPVALSTGLAGALLGELIIDGYMEIRDGLVVPANEGGPPDPLSWTVLELLRREDNPLPTWLKYLAQRSLAKVAGRMEAAGHVRKMRAKRMLRVSVTYVPTDRLEASRPMSVLASRLHGHYDIEPWYGVLAGFMAATGLHIRVLAGAPDESHEFMCDLIARSSPQGFQELYGYVESLVGAAVLVNRT